MTQHLRIEWDDRADVLYVGALASRVARSREAPHDLGLIFDIDAAGSVVGVRLLDASETSSDWWRAHPDVDLVPDLFRVAIDGWLLEHATAGLVLEPS